MESNKYIEIIKKVIESEVAKDPQDSLSSGYFFNLFSKITTSINTIIKIYNYPEVDDLTLRSYFETARNEYLSVNPIDIDPSNSLNRKDFKTWLTAARKEEMKNSWNYSERYFTLLEKSGRSEKVINEIRDTSLDILGKIGDPKSKESFYTKGLVVGSVQSGKTANFNAVINRAIDAGYNLIIVLSGLMEDLRIQTQLRIENDIVGEGLDIDTDQLVTKGVGKIRKFGNLGDKSVGAVISITSAKSDFNKSLLNADFSLNHTNILVCKNNVSVLRNLIVWLHDYLEENKDQHNIPLLILDDEADNASLNNEGKKGREYASKTNGHIRALLALFKRKTYLGYTATPFANVLADRNDMPENNWIVKYKLRNKTVEKELPRVDNLFPDDFIVLLNPPSNYIGAKEIFETIKPIENKAQLKIPLVEIIKDHIKNFPARVYLNEDGEIEGIQKISSQDEWDEKFGKNGSYLHFSNFKDYKKNSWTPWQSDGFPLFLPDSLKESILCFILSIAIKESRKPGMMHSSLYDPHHSMLIHISRYTKWQNTLKKLVCDYIKAIQIDIGNDNPGNPKSIFSVFERVWYKYYANVVEHISDFLPKGYEDGFLKPVSFETIKNFYLTDAVKNINVKALNSSTKDTLRYPKNSPQKVIAIGGNRLSRGFTLEGLTINYFVRSTDYSDTLLQMGRWFGYRTGYLDCCKLFITQESIDKFDAVTRAIEELEIEFRKMEEKDKTPENFVLRVKKHPGTLKITRPSILKDTLVVNWSYQDSLQQTTNFYLGKEKIEKVWADFRDVTATTFTFINKKKTDGTDAGFLVSETDIDGILKILRLENNFGADTCDSIIRFIELCKQKNKLTNWTIAIKTKRVAKSSEGKGILRAEESNLPQDITMTVRRGPSKENGQATNIFRDKFLEKKIFSASGKSAHLISAGTDLSVTLDDSQIESAIAKFRADRKEFYRQKYPQWEDSAVNDKAAEVTVPEKVFREIIDDQNGLLLIYVLDPYYVFLQEKGDEDPDMEKMVRDAQIDLNIPLIGYAIGFPPIDPDPGGIYVHGNYGIEDEDELNMSEEDSEVPNDINEN